MRGARGLRTLDAWRRRRRGDDAFVGRSEPEPWQARDSPLFSSLGVYICFSSLSTLSRLALVAIYAAEALAGKE